MRGVESTATCLHHLVGDACCSNTLYLVETVERNQDTIGKLGIHRSTSTVWSK